MPQVDFNVQVVDRYPLISHRGNFSGKASAFVKSIISGPWWRADPTTGKVPDTVERNYQFYINQGPVDMGIINAQATESHSTLSSSNRNLLGTYLPRNTLNNSPMPMERFKPRDESYREVYLWHPFTTKAESFIQFSTNPTTY